MRLVFALTLALTPVLSQAQATIEEMEFFENKIRPVLMESCFSCHGERRTKGGLHVGSRVLLLRGGDSGTAALVPGAPEKSPLIEAIQWTNPDLQMPPKEQLSKEAIEDLTQWVAMGVMLA